MYGGKWGIYTKFLSVDFKESEYFGHLSADTETTLKWMLNLKGLRR